MNNTLTKIIAAGVILLFLGCDKKKDDLVEPFSSDGFPQIVLLADEGDGKLEDEDTFSFKITLADRVDPEKKELGGKVVPLKEAVTVQFAVTGFKGMAKLADYIKDAVAFYEIDDCTTSLDKGIDLKLQFNPATGTGQVTFPVDVEEIEIEFETDESLFDDDVFNTATRNITIQLTGISANNTNVTVNKSAEFEYTVQDDEGIYGEWELDPTDPVAFGQFKKLFGLVNPDIRDLEAAKVKEILLEFEYGEVKAIVELKEKEAVDDCGTIEMENKVIEIEAELEELTDDELEGDIEFGEVLEIGQGAFREFAYKGSFEITGKTLSITLKGKFGTESTEKITLILEK